jgi:predicted nuclease of predicted toxin-antitoxin system
MGSSKFSFVLFVDRALGRSAVPSALKLTGANVEIHMDHFAPDAPDIEWLSKVAESGWVVLTKDKNIGRNYLELRAVAQFKIRMFVLVSGNLTRQQMADTFVKAFPKMNNFCIGNKPPFIAKIYSSGKIQMWKDCVEIMKQFPNT